MGAVGGKKYTDKQVFTLTPEQGGKQCRIEAFSASQGFSVSDFSRNHCDIRNLYCRSADGCKPISSDFTGKEVEVKPSLCASQDFSKCIVKVHDSEIIV